MGEQVPFYGFNFGEYGLQSPFLVGFAVFRQHLLYKGWWSGTNVARTLDGTLIPQPQPAKMTTVGLPGPPDSFGIAYNQNGTPQMWATYTSSGDVYLSDVIIGASTITFTRVSAGGIVGGGGRTVYASWASGDSAYLAAGSGVYRLALTGPAFSQLNAAGGHAICVYGDRLLFAGDSSGVPQSRVYYSAPGDFTSWPANNYFDVGTAGILALIPLRHSLAIAKGSGPDAAWWMFNGVPGVNDSLRPVSQPPGVADINAACALGDGTVGFFPGTATNSFPCLFNGSAISRERHLAGKVTAPAVVAPLAVPGDWVVTDGSKMLMRRDGAWSYHSFSPAFRLAVASDPINDALFFYRSADSSFYRLSAYQQVPAGAANPTTPAGTVDPFAVAPASASFSLPEWWTRGVDEVAVKAVVVDFRKYNTGDTNPNTMTVEAVPMRLYTTDGKGLAATSTQASSSGDGIVPQALTFSEAAAVSSASGTRGRFIAKFVPQFGNGFRIDFSGLRGVAIEKVVVSLDQRGGPGV